MLPLSFDLLKDQPGLRPAPYLASRGLKWIQRTSPASMDDGALRDYLAESHRIVASGLPKRTQLQLGLLQLGLLPHSSEEPTTRKPTLADRIHAPNASYRRRVSDTTWASKGATNKENANE